jgi:hypothetical protein
MLAGTWLTRCLVAVFILALILHVIVVLSVLTQDRPIIWPLHNDTIHRLGKGADFFAIYHAGVNVSMGISPYEENDDGFTPYYHPFRYLPIVAYAAQPLTELEPMQAYALWVIILESALVLLLIALYLRYADKRIWLLSASLLVMSSPYFLELFMGQFTFLTVTLCALALLLPFGPAYFTASVLLKPLCLAVLPAFVRDRRYWLHGISAIVCVCAVSVPYFLRHPESWQVFADANFRPQGHFDTGNYGLVRLLGLIAYDLKIVWLAREDHWVPLISCLRVLTFGATSLVVLFGRNRNTVVGACALLLAHFLTYQHVWEHHMSAVIVIGALLLTVKHRPAWFTTTVLLSMLCLALPTPFGLFDTVKDRYVYDPSGDWPVYALYLLFLPKVVPTLTLFVASIVWLSRRPKDVPALERDRQQAGSRPAARRRRH